MNEEGAAGDMEAMKTRGQLEAAITKAIIQFEKDFMGRGPLDSRSYVIDDMVLVRLKNALTPVELRLAETEDPRQGRDLIKQVRLELLELDRPMLESADRVLGGKPPYGYQHTYGGADYRLHAEGPASVPWEGPGIPFL